MFEDKISSHTEVFKQLFCDLYNTPAPCLPLRDILHWQNSVKKLGIESQNLHNGRAYIMADYFYLPSSSLPQYLDIMEAKASGQSLEADFALLPMIRNTEKSSNLDFFDISIPSFFESVYRVSKSLEEDLRLQLGRKRYKELLRVEKKIDYEYCIEFIEGHNILKKPEMLIVFDRLHCLNIRKYNHERNHYNSSIMSNLIKSCLIENMLFLFYYDVKNKRYVLSSFMLMDRSAEKIYMMVLGIDHDQIPSSRNLYTDCVYKLYKYGIENNIIEFNLGRSSPMNKLKMGANHFYIVSNYIMFLKNTHREDLIHFKNKSIDSIKKELEELEIYMQSRISIKDCFYLPSSVT